MTEQAGPADSRAEPDQSEPDGSLLCQSCGLCCSGTLYNGVALDEEDARRLAPKRLPLLQLGEHTVMELGCTCLQGTRCGIYEDRPRLCAEYRCKLLRNVEKGKVGLDDARGRVERVRNKVAELRTMLPPELADRRVRDAVLEHERGATNSPAEWRRDNAEMLLLLGELTILCRRDFDPRFGRPEGEMPADGPR